MTCGLDHVLGPETVDADSYNYPGKRDRRAGPARPPDRRPGPPDRLRRAVGGRPLHPLGRGRGASGRGVRREPAPDPPHRGRGRRRRDPRPRPRRERGLPRDAAHVLLPRQPRLAGAGGGRALPRARSARRSGPRTRRATATRAWATTVPGADRGLRRAGLGARHGRGRGRRGAGGAGQRPPRLRGRDRDAARTSSPAPTSGSTSRRAPTPWASSPRRTTSWATAPRASGAR